MTDSRSRCDMEVDRIQDYLDGRITPEERGLFEAHLAGCTQCASEVASMQRLFSRLAVLPLFAPGPDFDRMVLSAVLPERRRAFGLSPAVWFAAGYVVFTAALLVSAMVLSGALPVNGQVSPVSVFWHDALRACLDGFGAARNTWQMARAVLSPFGVLAGLGQVAARCAIALVMTPDGRFYLALSAITALAFLVFARRPQKGGSLVASAI